MEQSEGIIKMRPASVDPAWLVAPRSYLLDRMTPRIEEIRVPSSVIGGGQLRYSCGELVASPTLRRGISGALRRGRTTLPRRFDMPGVMIDLRRRNPGNWAHMLTNHLPYVFALSEATQKDWSELTLLLPKETPEHVLGAADLFGLRTLCTDETLHGPGIGFEPDPWTGNRGIRVAWARIPRVRTALDLASPRTETTRDLPRRVFISRRDSRRLTNEAEITAHLTTHGLETIYAEDLEPIEQFRLLAQAELIVAIHGAALAPLLYRPPEAPPATVVELFPVGHMTMVWRALAAQVGCRWAGVRGHMRPRHITGGLYDLTKPFTRYSAESFEIDPVSLDRALELAA